MNSIYISLPQSDIRRVNCKDSITVKRLTEVVLGQVSLIEYFKLFELEAQSVMTDRTIILHDNMSLKNVIDKLGPQWLINYRLFLKIRHLSQILFENFKANNTQMLEFLYFQCLEDIVRKANSDDELIVRFLAIELKRRLLESRSVKLKSIWINQQLNTFSLKIKVLAKSIKNELPKLKTLNSPQRCILELLHLHRCTTGLIYRDFSCFLIVRGDLNVVELSIKAMDGISYRVSGQSWRMVCRGFSGPEGIEHLEMKKLEEGKAKVSMKTGSSDTPVEFYGAVSVIEEITYYIRKSCLLDNESSSSPKDDSSIFADTLSRYSPEMVINRQQLEIFETVGEGQFGLVYRGILSDLEGNTREVAVKIHHGNDSNSLNSFYEEANLMKMFRHVNIIEFFGLMDETPAIVMEFAQFGQLRTYLQSQEEVSSKTLMLFSYQVTCAVEYIHSMNFIHRDLAARNILVCDQDCIKLSDFGMCCLLPSSQVHHMVNDGKMPIKWMAPESLRHRVFTKATDVWMLGVCLWEIWDEASHKPFTDIANSDMLLYIEEGNRLCQPPQCPVFFYEFMKSCWQSDSQLRPTCSEMIKYIETLFDDQTESSYTASISLNESLNTLDAEDFQSVVNTPATEQILLAKLHRNDLSLDSSQLNEENDLPKQRNDKLYSEDTENLQSFYPCLDTPVTSDIKEDDSHFEKSNLSLNVHYHYLDSALSQIMVAITDFTNNIDNVETLDECAKLITTSLRVFLDNVQEIGYDTQNDLTKQSLMMVKGVILSMLGRLESITMCNDCNIDRALCLISQLGISSKFLYDELYRYSVSQFSSDL